MNGQPLRQQASGSDASGWYYQAASATVVVDTPELSTAQAFTVALTGGRPVNRPEPPAP